MLYTERFLQGQLSGDLAEFCFFFVDVWMLLYIWMLEVTAN